MKWFRTMAICGLLAPGLALATLENEPPDESAELAAEVMEDHTAAEAAAEEVPENPVPSTFHDAYFDGRPEKFLVDPKGLLSPVDFRERLDFLNYHAGDSAIDLYVYVFAADQDLPAGERMRELVERFFAEGRPAVVVHYFWGNPQRTALYLSPSLLAVVPTAEQHRALESSVLQALNQVHAAGQIEAFLVQMSIRIYWMERMLGVAADAEPVAVMIKPKKATEPKAGPLEALRPHFEQASRHAMPAAVIACALTAVFGIGFWLKRRARHRFPEFDVEPRLGGAHAAGVGAVISFASAAVPPASQKNQLSGYPRWS